MAASGQTNDDGDCCAIGVVCKARGVDVSKIDYEDTQPVGDAVGIARAMAAEIEFENDDDFGFSDETPAQRWERMRKWVSRQLETGHARTTERKDWRKSDAQPMDSNPAHQWK